MQPSKNAPNFSVTLDQWLEVTTVNDALKTLMNDVPDTTPDIERTMHHVISGAALASTVHNGYTLLSGDTEQSPEVAVELTPTQVEIAHIALTYAARTSFEPVESDFLVNMAQDLKATAVLSDELSR